MVIINTLLVGFYMVSGARAESIGLSASLRLGEQWDGNLFQTGEGGEITQDFVTEITPQIAVRSIATRNQYSASYLLHVRRYSRYRESDYISHTANIGMTSQLSQNTSLSFGDNYVFTPDSQEASALGIQTPRNNILSNRVFVTMLRTFSDGNSASLNLSNSIQDFEDPSLFDTRSDSASLSGAFGYSSNMSITMSYTYTKNLYRTATGVESFTEIHSAQAGISSQLSPESSISASGGVVYVDDFDEASNWTASASYAKGFQETSFNMNYARSVANSSGLTNEINISDNVSMSLTHTFSRTFNANMGGSLIKNRSEPSNNVDRTSYNANAGFAWQPLEWLAFDASYTHFQQWVEDALGENMSRDQVFIGLTAAPGEMRF